MPKITLFLYPDEKHYMARVADGRTGEAWPVRRYVAAGIEFMDAVVAMHGGEGTETYRFEYDGANWSAENKPIASVRALDLFPAW